MADILGAATLERLTINWRGVFALRVEPGVVDRVVAVADAIGSNAVAVFGDVSGEPLTVDVKSDDRDARHGHPNFRSAVVGRHPTPKGAAAIPAALLSSLDAGRTA